jgi:hypothetical protein
VHAVRHTSVEALHVKRPHPTVPPATHAPEPLHVEGFVCVVVPAGHVPAAQTVGDGHLLHAPAPSHAPVVPHVLAAWVAQSPPCALPAPTTPHVPSGLPVYVFAQALHFVAHAVLQQKPSTQAPLAHPADVVQVAPCARATQVLLALQRGRLAGQSPLVQQVGSADRMQLLPHVR